MMHSVRMKFWEYARERYRIFLRKNAGFPAPWTQDPILQKYRFCNIFREDDKVTIWVREHIREPLANAKGDLIFALIAARLFNLPSTLEKLLPVLQPGQWDPERATRLIDGLKPVVNGAYIVIGANGMPKGPGIIAVLDRIYPYRHRVCENIVRANTLEAAVAELVTFDRIGHFLAYEVATDLRHTPILRDATDVMAWANPGPGAARGLSRLLGEDKYHFDRNSKKDREEMFQLMSYLLEDSRHPALWPAEWPRWEMREVEHTLCEVDKYLRVAYGEGRPKQGYPGNGT